LGVKFFESFIPEPFFQQTGNCNSFLADCLRKTMHLEKLHAEFIDYHSMHPAHEHHVMTLAYINMGLAVNVG
jgi:hypothetical protein